MRVCVWHIQSESFEVARIFSEAEARRVGNLLQVSAEALQTVITHRVTVSTICLQTLTYSLTYLLSYILPSYITTLSLFPAGNKTWMSLSHHCTQETTYDRIYCPLSVECAIESR